MGPNESVSVRVFMSDFAVPDVRTPPDITATTAVRLHFFLNRSSRTTSPPPLSASGVGSAGGSGAARCRRARSLRPRSGRGRRRLFRRRFAGIGVGGSRRLRSSRTESRTAPPDRRTRSSPRTAPSIRSGTPPNDRPTSNASLGHDEVPELMLQDDGHVLRIARAHAAPTAARRAPWC